MIQIAKKTTKQDFRFVIEIFLKCVKTFDLDGKYHYKLFYHLIKRALQLSQTVSYFIEYLIKILVQHDDHKQLLHKFNCLFWSISVRKFEVNVVIKALKRSNNQYLNFDSFELFIETSIFPNIDSFELEDLDFLEFIIFQTKYVKQKSLRIKVIEMLLKKIQSEFSYILFYKRKKPDLDSL